MALPPVLDYLLGMDSLTALDNCLAQALHRTRPVAAELLAPAEACGHVLAEDLRLTQDQPPTAEALRAGVAVAALDLVGAGPGNPVALPAPARVLPGAPLPPGSDAVLAEEGTERDADLWSAIRPIGPGEGVRRAGQDARAGEPIQRAGRRLAARHGLVAALSGIAGVAVRRPRVRVALDDPHQADFVATWLRGLGARPVADAPQLTIRTATDHRPRLALYPGETAWLAPEGEGLALTVPIRFDGMVAALLGLGLPALAALCGAVPQPETRPLTRKATSSVGLSELVLLADEAAAWAPGPAGTVTLGALAAARAFAILPPDSEGLPAGAQLPGLPIDRPFG